MKKLFASLALLICFLSEGSSDAHEQDIEEPVPGTVYIDIENRMQQTPVWCWVAVAEQLIEHSRGTSPAQCALVAAANGTAPVYCCSGLNSQCVRSGTMDQLRTLLLAYGRYASTVIPAPLDPMVLYRHLVDGHPIVLQVRTSSNTTHVVVLKGMRFTRNSYGLLEAWIIVNDPMVRDMPLLLYSRVQGTIVNALIVN